MKGNIIVAAIILGAAVMAAACIIAFAGAHPQNGARFQVIVGPNRAFMIDTRTGQAWEKFLSDSGGPMDADFGNPKLENVR